MSTYRRQHTAAGSFYGRRGFDIARTAGRLFNLGRSVAHHARAIGAAFRGGMPKPSSSGVAPAGKAVAGPARTAAATAAPAASATEPVSLGGVKLSAADVQALSSASPQFASALSGAGKAVAAPAATAAATAGTEAAAGAAEAGAAMGGLAAAAGPVGAAFAAIVAKSSQLSRQLNELSQSAIVANESFRDVSPAMAQIFAQRDVSRTFRDVEKGDALAQSASALVEAEQRKEDNTKDIEILLGSIQNEVGAAWEGFKGELFKPLNAMAKSLNDIFNFGRSAGDKVPLGEWFRGVVADAKEGTRRGRPVIRGRERKPDDGNVGGGGAGGAF